MVGSKLAVAMACILAATVLSGCGERAFEPIASADWQAGYSYSYELSGHIKTTTRITAGGGSGEPDRDMDLPVTPWDAYTVINTHATHDGKPVYVAKATRSMSMGSVSPSGVPQ